MSIQSRGLRCKRLIVVDVVVVVIVVDDVIVAVDVVVVAVVVTDVVVTIKGAQSNTRATEAFDGGITWLTRTAGIALIP